MSLNSPSKQVLQSIDWAALDAINDETRRLALSRELTSVAFDGLWKRALMATGDRIAFLESLALYRGDISDGQGDGDWDEVRADEAVVKQRTSYTCGVAALRSVMTDLLGSSPSEEDLTKELGVDPRKGALVRDIVRVAIGHRLRARTIVDSDVRQLSRLLARGSALIALIQSVDDPADGWDGDHYVRVVSATDGSVDYLDPSRGEPGRRELDPDSFALRWHGHGDDGERVRKLVIVIDATTGDAGDWDEEKHPRGPGGKFGAGPWNPKKVAEGLGKQFEQSPEGFSWRPGAGNPTSGIMVAEHPDRDLGAKIDPEMGKAAVRAQMQEWAAKVRDDIRKDPEMHFGGWIDGGKLYLDVSRRYPESKEAEARAAGAPDRNNQIGIWHVGRGEFIPTGGTGEKTKR